MNPRKIGTVVVVIFLLSTLVFIFSNSLLPVALSKEKSLGVMKFVKPVLGLFVGEEAVTDHLQRNILIQSLTTSWNSTVTEESKTTTPSSAASPHWTDNPSP